MYANPRFRYATALPFAIVALPSFIFPRVLLARLRFPTCENRPDGVARFQYRKAHRGNLQVVEDRSFPLSNNTHEALHGIHNQSPRLTLAQGLMEVLIMFHRPFFHGSPYFLQDSRSVGAGDVTGWRQKPIKLVDDSITQSGFTAILIQGKVQQLYITLELRGDVLLMGLTR